MQVFGLRRREVGELNKEIFDYKQGKCVYPNFGMKGKHIEWGPVCDKEMNEKMKIMGVVPYH